MKKHRELMRRVWLLIGLMGLWGTVIGARLYFLHVVESADWKQRADRQQGWALEVSPRRGVIYDRNGNELAISIKVDSVFAAPYEIEDPAEAAQILARITGSAQDDLFKRLDTDKQFVWIKRKVSEAQAAEIRNTDLKGIYFQKEDQRFYPKNESAAHVLGYVNIDEEGMGGLEYKYNSIVRGQPGKVVVMSDARRRRYASIEQPPAPGANLVTTLDENIQYILEKELQKIVAETRASGVYLIAMDPGSGEILGMANHPRFNPNEYARYPQVNWINRAVSQVYEPGSTFKIVTVGAALEERLTTPYELIDCQMGSITLFGHRINDHKPFGILSVQQVMQQSSDVGVIKLGLRLGDDRFADYIGRMGFGRPTKIDLPGEERGLTKPASRWSRVSVGAISMGQEIGTTPLQVVNLVSAVANGGILYRPYVVKRIEHPVDGLISETEQQGERILSAETAGMLHEMLETVVTEGTAKSGRLEGYRAAGKTGTAQKIDETGRYSKVNYIASFAGFAPASDPRVSIIVVIDEPKGGIYGGGQLAAPAFKRIAEQILHYMSVPPDVPLYAPQYTLQASAAPQSAPAAPARVAPPAYEARVMEASFPVDGFSGDIEVPDFYGKSLRQATEQALRLGLRLQSSGSGSAVEQSPAPGTGVRAGTRIQVRFGSQK